MDPVIFAAFHKPYVNKCIGVAVKEFAFEDSTENFGDGLKIGFYRAVGYKVVDKEQREAVIQNYG